MSARAGDSDDRDHAGDGGADDTDDAAHLHDLRSVLRSMPDEEPPMRGMAELLAAARARVEPAPSLWQRIGAGFAAMARRPAVLAFASVTVVVSGALIVRQHQQRLEPAQTAPVADATRAMSAPANEPPPPPMTPTPEPMATGQAAPGASAGSAAAAAIEKEPPSAPADQVIAKQVVAVAIPPPAPAHRPAVAHGAPARLASPMKPSAPSVAMGEVSADPSSGAVAAAEAPATPRPAPRSFARAPDAPDADGIAADKAAAPRVAGSPVAQWLKQCQRAAAASDCDSVRKLAAQIAEADAAFYREHVIKDAALAHCLTPPIDTKIQLGE